MGSLHTIPIDVLLPILAHLPGNEAVRLGSLHPHLRQALAAVASLHVTLRSEAPQWNQHSMQTRSEAGESAAKAASLDSFSRFLSSKRTPAITALSLELHTPACTHSDPGAAEAFRWEFPGLTLTGLRSLCVTATGCPAWSEQQWGAALTRHVIGSCPNIEVCIVDAADQCSEQSCQCHKYRDRFANSLFLALHEVCLPATLRHLHLDFGPTFLGGAAAKLTADFSLALPASLQRLDVRAGYRIFLELSPCMCLPSNITQLTLCTTELKGCASQSDILPAAQRLVQGCRLRVVFPDDICCNAIYSAGWPPEAALMHERQQAYTTLRAACVANCVSSEAWEASRPTIIA